MQRMPITNICRVRPSVSLPHVAPRRALWTAPAGFHVVSIFNKPTAQPFSRQILSTRRISSLPLVEKAPSIVNFTQTWTARVRSTYFQGGTRGNNNSSQRPPKRGLFSTIIAGINRLPSVWIFYGILGINAGVYGLWWYAGQSWKNFRDPELYYWLQRNFVVSLPNIMSGRVWTLLTSCFSHEGTAHILMNGLTFFFMAPVVLGTLGNAGFLTLYLGGGLASSLVSLAWNRFISHRSTGSHGASGAIYSVLAFFACVAPQTKFLLFFVVPVPAWLCVGGLFAWDLWSSVSSNRGAIDSPGHMGGMLAGVLFFLRMRRGMVRFR